MENEEKDFIRLFNILTKAHRKDKVFYDFVKTSSIALHNAVRMDDTLEQEYLQIINQYDSNEIQNLCEMLNCVIEMLQTQPCDILGKLYIDLGVQESNKGQFFTPDPISQFMAQILQGSYDAPIDLLEEQPFITLSDPACGAGSMVLAFVNEMIKKCHNPATSLWCQCIDIDETAAYMCYLQLALWNVPAQIIIGDSLTMDFKRVLYTPAHYLWLWDYKLKKREDSSGDNSNPKKPFNPDQNQIGQQFDFDF